MLKNFISKLQKNALLEALFVIAIILIIALVTSWNVFVNLANYVGQGDFNYSQLPFSLKEKFHYLPLAVLDGFSLPTPYAVSLLAIFYYSLGSLFMFFFAKEYIKNVFPTQSTTSLAPYIAMLVYAFYPFNIMGDVFPTLILTRSLAPLSLLLLTKSLRDRSYTDLLLASVVLALMQLADPRSVIFLVPISFSILLIPSVILSPNFKEKTRLTLMYCLHLIATFAFSGVELVYRLIRNTGSISSIPTSVASIFNLNSFTVNFWFTTPLDIMSGTSFLATHKFFQETIETQFSLSFSLVNSCLLLISLFALSIPILYFRRENKQYKAYLMPMLLLTVLTILLFSNFTSNRDVSLDALPILPRLLFYVIGPTSPNFIKNIAVLFRTSRLLNLVYSIAISLLASVCLVVVTQKCLSLSISLGNNVKHYFIFSAKLKHFILSLFLINIILWSVPVLTYGTGPTRPHPYFEISDRTVAYSNVVSQLNPKPPMEWSVSVNDWAGGLPNLYFLHGVEGGTKQYAVRYTVDSKFSPLLRDSDFKFMSEFLGRLGVKYVVLDGYRLGSDSLAYYGEQMNDSQAFKFRAASDQLFAYEILNEDPITVSSSAVFVLGGLEDYRSMFPVFENMSDNTVVPIFLDSTLEDTAALSESTWPLLVGPHKSLFDVIPSFAMNENGTVVVTPATWPESWDRFSNWSPGYITDTIGGTWSYSLLDLPNYEWSYSFRPDYGYVFVDDAQDVLTTEFTSESGVYHVLVRALKSPRSGTINFKLDDVLTESLITKWNFKSSEFIWTNLGEQELSEGSHRFSIENIEGFNAVNLVLLIPDQQWKQASNLAQAFVDSRDVIYAIDLDKQESDPFLGTITTSINILKDDQYSYLGLNEIKMNQESINDNNPFPLKKGTYELQAKSLGTVFISSFEEFDNDMGSPIQWSTPAAPFSGALDPTTTVHGNYSYLLSTDSSEKGKWSWVKSPDIPVKPGAEYVLTTNMKWQNVKQSHIVVEGFATDNSTIRLTTLPSGMDGSSDWKKFTSKLTIPENVTRMRLQLNAGWVNDPPLGEALTWFDAIFLQEVLPEKDESNIAIIYESKDSLKQAIFSDSNELEVISTNITSYDSAYLEYSIKLRMNGSAMIVIPEVFDGGWRIKEVTGLEIHEMPSYYILSGFTAQSNNSPNQIEIVLYNSLNEMIGTAEYITFGTIGVIIISCVLWNIFAVIKKKIKSQPKAET